MKKEARKGRAMNLEPTEQILMVNWHFLITSLESQSSK
jgi:hypothetical protein